MKKIITYIYTFLILTVPLFVFAETPPLEIGLKNPLEAKSVSEVMTAFVDILIQLGVVAVTLAIIYAGFLFVASRGNPEELKKAKVTFYWTILGALILLGAKIIAAVIENTLKNI